MCFSLSLSSFVLFLISCIFFPPRRPTGSSLPHLWARTPRPVHGAPCGPLFIFKKIPSIIYIYTGLYSIYVFGNDRCSEQTTGREIKRRWENSVRLSLDGHLFLLFLLPFCVSFSLYITCVSFVPPCYTDVLVLVIILLFPVRRWWSYFVWPWWRLLISKLSLYTHVYKHNICVCAVIVIHK